MPRKAAETFTVVLVTAPDMQVARKIARAALKARLIACANLVPRLESHYRWQGKIESANEVLMILKTRTARLDELERVVLANHSYETPEFIALPASRINRRYAQWLLECTD